MDPPFSEDIYTYKPSERNSSAPRQETNERKNTSIRCSSIFRKSFIKRNEPQNKAFLSTNISNNVIPVSNGILKLYQTDSMKTSLSNTCSNSVITYPPTVNTSFDRIQEKRNNKCNNVNKDLPKNSFIEFTELFFHPKEKSEKVSKTSLEAQRNKHFELISDEQLNNVDIQEKMVIKQHVSVGNNSQLITFNQNKEETLRVTQNKIEVETENYLNSTCNSLKGIDSQIKNNNNIQTLHDNLYLKQNILHVFEESSQLKEKIQISDSNDILIQPAFSKKYIERNSKTNVDRQSALNLPSRNVQNGLCKSISNALNENETYKPDHFNKILSSGNLKSSENFERSATTTIKNNFTLYDVENNNKYCVNPSNINKDANIYSLDEKENLLVRENNSHTLKYEESKESHTKSNTDIFIERQDINDLNCSRDKRENIISHSIEIIPISHDKKFESNINYDESQIKPHKIFKQRSILNAIIESEPHIIQNNLLNDRGSVNTSLIKNENNCLDIKVIELKKNDKTNEEKSLAVVKRDTDATITYENSDVIGSVTEITILTINKSNANNLNVKDENIISSTAIYDKSSYTDNIIYTTKYPNHKNFSDTKLIKNTILINDIISEIIEDTVKNDINMSVEITSVNENATTSDKILEIKGKNNSEHGVTTILNNILSIVPDDHSVHSKNEIHNKSIKNSDDPSNFLKFQSSTTETNVAKLSGITKNANEKLSSMDNCCSTTDQGHNKTINVSSDTQINTRSKNQSHISSLNKDKTVKNLAEPYNSQYGLNTVDESTNNINKISSYTKENFNIMQSKNNNIHNDKENNFVSDENITLKKSRQNENRKNIIDISSGVTENIFEVDKYKSKMMKNNASNNNIVESLTVETESIKKNNIESNSDKQYFEEQFETYLAKNVVTKKSQEDFISQTSSEITRLARTSSKSVSELQPKETSLNTIRNLGSMKVLDEDSKSGFQYIFNDVEITSKKNLNYKADNSVGIIHDNIEKNIEPQRTIINGNAHKVLFEKQTNITQSKNPLIADLSSLKSSGKLVNNNIDSTNTKTEIDIEKIKDVNYSSDIINTRLHESSSLEVITYKEKLKTFRKCYTVGASIAPFYPIQETKHPVIISLGFQSYINKNNERVLKTFDIDKEAERFPYDTITIVKSLVRLPNKNIKIPIDEENYISVDLYQNVDFNNTLEQNQSLTKKNYDITTKGIQCKTKKIHNNSLDVNLISIYEKELVPLRNVFKDLKNEIDSLAKQKPVFKKKLQKTMKVKSNRVTNINTCGCIKK